MKVAFSIFGEKMNGVSVIKQRNNGIYEKDRFFAKKNQNPVYYIKIVDLWKTVSITPVHRYLFSV